MALTINPSTFAITSSGQIHGAIVITTDSTDGGITFTAAGMVGGVIVRSGCSATFSDTTPTATQILAAMPSATIGTAFNLRIKNATDFTQTILAGSGVTLSGTITILANSYIDFIGIFTNVTSPALTISNIGGATNSLSSVGMVKLAYITTDFSIANSNVSLTWAESQFTSANTMPFLVKQKLAFADTYTAVAGIAPTITLNSVNLGAFLNPVLTTLTTIDDYYLTYLSQTVLGVGAAGLLNAHGGADYVLNSGVLSSTPFRVTIEFWGLKF